MPKRNVTDPPIDRQAVFDAIASTLQCLAKARGLLVEAQRPEQLHDVALELERARDLAAAAYETACGLYRGAAR